MSEPKVKVIMFETTAEEAAKMSPARAIMIHSIARCRESYRTGLWLVGPQLVIATVLLLLGRTSHTALCAVFGWGLMALTVRAGVAWLASRSLNASSDS